MSDIPIIFSAQMVQASLAGRKTMTRRLAWRKPDPAITSKNVCSPSSWQRVKPSDRLWVREHMTCVGDGIWKYAADREGVMCRKADESAMVAWAHHEERGSVPSIHMPRWASRLTMVVTATKIERIQAIDEQDACREGVRPENSGIGAHGEPVKHYRTGFVRLWRELYGDAAWFDNPEVVALTFTVHKQNIDNLKVAA